MSDRTTDEQIAKWSAALAHLDYPAIEASTSAIEALLAERARADQHQAATVAEIRGRRAYMEKQAALAGVTVARLRAQRDEGKARIAKALDLIREWRSTPLPAGVNLGDEVALVVRDRLRGLYAALDGEAASNGYAELAEWHRGLIRGLGIGARERMREMFDALVAERARADKAELALREARLAWSLFDEPKVAGDLEAAKATIATLWKSRRMWQELAIVASDTVDQYWDRMKARTVRIVAAERRLMLAQDALIADGYFTDEQVGPDIAPRIVERIGELKRRIDNTRALHAPSSDRDEVGLCRWDGEASPCATIRALDGEVAW